MFGVRVLSSNLRSGGFFKCLFESTRISTRIEVESMAIFQSTFQIVISITLFFSFDWHFGHFTPFLTSLEMPSTPTRREVAPHASSRQPKRLSAYKGKTFRRWRWGWWAAITLVFSLDLHFEHFTSLLTSLETPSTPTRREVAPHASSRQPKLLSAYKGETFRRRRWGWWAAITSVFSFD